jgi:hypothetical protein
MREEALGALVSIRDGLVRGEAGTRAHGDPEVSGLV